MEKSDIIKYCSENGLSYVTDSTNADTDYTRNKIRSEIIPILKQINSGAVKNAYRMTENLREDALCLENIAQEFIKDAKNGLSIEVQKLCEAPSAISNRALMSLYGEASDGKSLEATHIEALRALSKKCVPHSSISLPNGIEGVIEDKKLILRKKESKKECVEEYRISLSDGENIISQTNSEIFIGNSHSEKNVYKKSILLSIDFDSINGELIARDRRAGDKIKMGGMNKSLKKLMCDKKIPIELRSRIPVICDEKGILAVPFIGVRDGAKYTQKNGQTELDIYFYLL